MFGALLRDRRAERDAMRTRATSNGCGALSAFEKVNCSRIAER
jgi:hypothetical protein